MAVGCLAFPNLKILPTTADTGLGSRPLLLSDQHAKGCDLASQESLWPCQALHSTASALRVSPTLSWLWSQQPQAGWLARPQAGLKLEPRGAQRPKAVRGLFPEQAKPLVGLG